MKDFGVSDRSQSLLIYGTAFPKAMDDADVVDIHMDVQDVPQIQTAEWKKENYNKKSLYLSESNMVQAKSIRNGLIGKPLRLEHHPRTVGKILDVIIKEGKLKITGEISDRTTIGLVRSRKIRGLSIRYKKGASNSLSYVEVSVVSNPFHKDCEIEVVANDSEYINYATNQTDYINTHSLHNNTTSYYPGYMSDAAVEPQADQGLPNDQPVDQSTGNADQQDNHQDIQQDAHQDTANQETAEQQENPETEDLPEEMDQIIKKNANLSPDQMMAKLAAMEYKMMKNTGMKHEKRSQQADTTWSEGFSNYIPDTTKEQTKTFLMAIAKDDDGRNVVKGINGLLDDSKKIVDNYNKLKEAHAALQDKVSKYESIRQTKPTAPPAPKPVQPQMQSRPPQQTQQPQRQAQPTVGAKRTFATYGSEQEDMESQILKRLRGNMNEGTTVRMPPPNRSQQIPPQTQQPLQQRTNKPQSAPQTQDRSHLANTPEKIIGMPKAVEVFCSSMGQQGISMHNWILKGVFEGAVDCSDDVSLCDENGM